jgi:hypothetical protein
MTTRVDRRNLDIPLQYMPLFLIDPRSTYLIYC